MIDHCGDTDSDRSIKETRHSCEQNFTKLNMILDIIRYLEHEHCFETGMSFPRQTLIICHLEPTLAG